MINLKEIILETINLNEDKNKIREMVSRNKGREGKEVLSSDGRALSNTIVVATPASDTLIYADTISSKEVTFKKVSVISGMSEFTIPKAALKYNY